MAMMALLENMAIMDTMDRYTLGSRDPGYMIYLRVS
jgi:hypothetical protein